jgi:hypothetical protein
MLYFSASQFRRLLSDVLRRYGAVETSLFAHSDRNGDFFILEPLYDFAGLGVKAGLVLGLCLGFGLRLPEVVIRRRRRKTAWQKVVAGITVGDVFNLADLTRAWHSFQQDYAHMLTSTT